MQLNALLKAMLLLLTVFVSRYLDLDHLCYDDYLFEKLNYLHVVILKDFGYLVLRLVLFPTLGNNTQNSDFLSLKMLYYGVRGKDVTMLEECVHI